MVLRAFSTKRSQKRPATLRRGARIIVTDDGNGLSFAVCACLDAEGFSTEIVTAGARVPSDADGVIYLSALRDFPSIDEAIALQLDAFQAARAVAEKFTREGGLFVAVQDTGGRFATDEWCEPNKAPTGGLAGLAKTAALEWPLATVRSIDLDAGHRDVGEVARELVDEILQGGDDLEIGRPEGDRICLELVLSNDPEQRAEAPLGEGDVVVVSGGARGVTAACAMELARRTRARFVLLGRSPLPDEDPLESIVDDASLKRALMERAKADGEPLKPAAIGRAAGKIRSAREIRANLAAFAELGVEAQYVSVDVRDVSALSDVLQTVRDKWGPIRGLVHGAGVIEDRRIAEKTDDQFLRVYETKVSGFLALAAVTAGDPIQVMCLFSSVAARAGNVGQVDYAMANEVLNKMAQIEARRRPDAVVKSIAWGPWEGGMVGDDLARLFSERGIQLIPIDVGARMFADEVLSTSKDVEVVIGSLIEQEDASTSSSTEAPIHTPAVIERIAKLRADTHAFLLDHAIEGTPVLPLVVAIDLFLDTLAPWFSTEDVVIEDVRVLRGVRLRTLEEGEALRVRAERIANGIDGAKLELFDNTGELAYTARARVVSGPLVDAIDIDDSDDPFEGTVYDGKLLFHGPTLHALHDVGAPGESGMQAAVLRADQLGWSAPGNVDPAALDGAMQLAVLWTARWVNGLALPLRVECFRKFAAFEGDLQLRLRGRSATNTRSVSDVDVLDASGRLVAMLRGVEVYKYRSLGSG